MCKEISHIHTLSFSVCMKALLLSLIMPALCTHIHAQYGSRYWIDSLHRFYNQSLPFSHNQQAFPFYMLHDPVVRVNETSLTQKKFYNEKHSASPGSAATCGDTSVRVTFIRNLTELYPNFITKTKDNNILIPGGYIDDFTANVQKAQLVKTTATGKILWQVRSTYISKANYYFYRVFEASDGSIYAAGNYEKKDALGNNLYTAILIAKFNAAGNPLWQVTPASPLWASASYKGSAYITDIAEGADGFLYFTGRIDLPGVTKGIIMKYDNGGSLRWSKGFNEFSNICTAYGVNFNSSGNIMLLGKYPGAGASVVFAALLNSSTGDTLSTKAWQTSGTDFTYTGFTYDAYVTRLSNGNMALYGQLFNDGFFAGGRTKYTGMTEFNLNQDFVKGWQITGDYLSNGRDTKVFVHPDGSADFTFNNFLPGHLDSINLFIGNVENDQLIKQRVIKQKAITTHSFNNFCKMNDGGSVAVEQDYDNISSYNIYFLHNSDTAGLYFGKDTSFMQLEALSYQRYAGSVLSVSSGIVAAEINPPILFTQDTMKTVVVDSIITNCTNIKVSTATPSVCPGTPVIIKASKNKECLRNISWSYDAGVLQSYNVIDDSAISLIFSKQWKGYISASVCPGVADSVLITVTQSPGSVNLGSDTVLCPGNTIILNAKKGYVSYQWQDGSADSLLSITTAGKYFVSVTDSCGNTFSDTVNVVSIIDVSFSIGNDTIKCNADSVLIKAPGGYISYNWQPAYNLRQLNDSTVKVFPFTDTSYTIRAEKAPGCFVYDTIKISALSSPVINIGKDTAICSGDSVLLDAGPGFASYIWSNTSSSRQIKVFDGGQYIVNAAAANTCISSDTINITENLLPQPQLGNDTFLCEGKSLILNPGTFQTYLWQDGTTAPVYNANMVGKYSVTVTDNSNCINTDSVNVTAVYPSPGDLLADTVSFCQGESITLSADDAYSAYTWSTGSTSPSITINTDGLYWLQAENNFGCSSRDSIKVSYRLCTTAIYLPNAFTPNGDGKNDILRAKVYGVVNNFRLVIYNRFGQKIFESSNPAVGWNGNINGKTVQQGDTFVWICSYQLEGQPAQTAKGTVTVIR